MFSPYSCHSNNTPPKPLEHANVKRIWKVFWIHMMVLKVIVHFIKNLANALNSATPFKLVIKSVETIYI